MRTRRALPAEFHDLAERWAAMENEHDRVHPDRNECGGVGACTLMRVAHDLEERMVDALEPWRKALVR